MYSSTLFVDLGTRRGWGVIVMPDDVAGRWPATSSVHYTTNCNTQSSAPEDG